MTPIQPPMNDERLDRLVRQLLTERADDVAAAAMPADTMTAVVASHVRRGGIADRRPLLLFAAAVLILVAAGAVAVGSGLIRRGPEPQPAPEPVVVPSLDAITPSPTDAAVEAEHVFYTVVGELQIGDEGCTAANARRFGKTCTTSQLWVADADGGNARELFPESTDYRSIIDVSPTGDAMVFMAPADIDGQTVSASYLATLGPTGDVIDARVISNDVPDRACEGLCGMDSWHAFSPDGSHLAFVRFVRRDPAPEFGAVIAIMDLATGEVDELESTWASGSEGGTSMPRWSPDGTHFLFTRDKITNAINEFLDAGTFAVDVDGRNLRQVVDAALSARDGAWSPDGSTIAFTSAVGWLGVDQHSGKRENFNEDSDVYTVRADGSDLRRLTNFAPTRVDRGAPVQVGGHVNSWTRDGRIVFTLLKWAGEGDSTNLPPELWVMDADGANARQLDASSPAALNAVGCVDCPYPPGGDGSAFKAFWRPAP